MNDRCTYSVSPAALRLQRLLVDTLVATGAFPSPGTVLAESGLDAETARQLRAELAAVGWLWETSVGEIHALMPFSLSPTGITVEVDGRIRHALCAIDALGVSRLLDRRIEVRSRCITCSQTVWLETTPAQLVAHNPESIMIVRRSAPEYAGRACCDATRFACSLEHGQQWIKRFGNSHDTLMSLETAFNEARSLFDEPTT